MKDREENAVTEIARFIPRIRSISDGDLRTKTAEIYLELFRRSKWTRISDLLVTAELNVSNIEHTNAVVEVCIQIAQVMKEFHKLDVNRDWLISAAILHDASKLVEFEPHGRGQKKTKTGELYQHTLECLSLMTARNLPTELIHAVLSHTPQSAVMPRTIEAVLLYFADNMDYNVLRMMNGLDLEVRK